MFSAMHLTAATTRPFQINLAESVEDTEDDFSAVIPRMERLARVDLPATERQNAAAGSR
jgi:hypothetical protein